MKLRSMTVVLMLGWSVLVAVSAPNRLLDGQGGFLLATPAVQSDVDSTLNILRIVGNPNTAGRMLNFNANASDDHTIMHLRAFATDGASRIVLTEIFGNDRLIASCPTPDDKTVGECNYDWPTTSMLAGNNELRMEYARPGVGTAPGLRFQTYGRIGRP